MNSAMNTAPLGSGGREISRVGVGSWFWSPGEDDAMIAVIRHAIEGGVNWVDTAPAYGLGRCEELVGRAIAPYREDHGPQVFTKCGLTWHRSAGGAVEHDLDPASIRFECEQSLRRLAVERIDLYQIHWPDLSGVTEIEDAWLTMVELQKEGKVGQIGVSNFTVDLLERCEAIAHVDSIQQPLSLLQRAALEDLAPWAASHGTALLAYSPMAAGFLTGAFNRERAEALTEDDFRSFDPNFREPRLTENLELLARLRTITERLGCSLVELALGWVLSNPGMTAAVVGASVPAQVDQWLTAPSIELSPGDLDEIAAALRETRAGDAEVGPLPPALGTLTVAD